MYKKAFWIYNLALLAGFAIGRLDITSGWVNALWTLCFFSGLILNMWLLWWFSTLDTTIKEMVIDWGRENMPINLALRLMYSEKDILGWYNQGAAQRRS